jgi:hypothetical protein
MLLDDVDTIDSYSIVAWVCRDNLADLTFVFTGSDNDFIAFFESYFE